MHPAARTGRCRDATVMSVRRELDEHDLTTRAAALGDGRTDDELRSLRRSGAWTAIRRGAYVAAPGGNLGPLRRHRLLVEATVAAASPEAVVSHVSAAALHGLPLWRTPLGQVHVTRAGSSGGHCRTLLHTHRAALEPEDIVMIDGLATTSLCRTVADLARTLPREQAVVIGDAALHRGDLHIEQLLAELDGARHCHGTGRARRIVTFLDQRSESPAESRSRVLIARESLPVPELQLVVLGPDRRALGRTDFGWEQFRTVGEFDGAAKYGRLLAPGERPGDAVFREKLREDAIRDAGWRVVRWTWAELDRPSLIADRIRRAFAAHNTDDSH